MKLDETIIGYIAVTYGHDHQLEMYRSFELLDMFGNTYYDQEFIDFIFRTDLDSIERQDKFKSLLKLNIVKILNEHLIKVNPDISLQDANEILSGIFIIQHLEDYSYFQYRLSSMSNNAEVLSDILSSVSAYPSQKYITLLESVSDDFMKTLREMVEQRVGEELYNPDMAHEKMVKNLFSFTNKTPTIAGGLLSEGIGLNCTLQQLVALLPCSLSDVLSEQSIKNPVQTALDIVAFIMMGKDTYQTPIVAFKKHTNLFLKTPLLVTQITPIVTKIILDSNVHLEFNAIKQEKAANEKT